MFEALLAELRSRWNESRERFKLAEEEVMEWHERFSLPPEDILDRLALTLARGYVDGRFPWEFCDDVVNDLCWHGWSAKGLPQTRVAATFLAVFEIIEIGEVRPLDDPETERTMKQMLADILRKATDQ